MPKFTQESLDKKAVPKALPQEVIDEYKQYIEQLEKGNAGIVESGKDENVAVGRKALQEAGIQGKKYVKVQKVRGEDNKLKFWLITKKEWDDAAAKANARGEKIRGKDKGKKGREETIEDCNSV